DRQGRGDRSWTYAWWRKAMPLEERAQAAPSDLEADLLRQIDKRTWGQVRRLGIDVRPDRVVVTGTTPTYYLKQLVLEAILDVTRSRAVPPVSLNIQIGARD